MKNRRDLLDRLLAAQSELRRGFHVEMPADLNDEFAECGGITVHQMELLRRLLGGDEMTMGDVADAHGVGPSGATQLVDRLERSGLVRRARDARDRRVQWVVPTDRARAIARRFRVGVNHALEERFRVLDEGELRTYVELTERIATAWRNDARHHERRATA